MDKEVQDIIDSAEKAEPCKVPPIENPKPLKKAVVLWSGGVDSTYIIWRFLETMEIGGVKYDKIKVMQVDWHNQAGVEGNRYARDSIKKVLNTKYRDTIDSLVTFVEEHTITFTDPLVGGGLMQPPLWLLIGLYCVNLTDDLIFGYVKTDCFWHKANDFNMASFHIQKIMGKEDVILRYPLEWMQKHEIISEMKKGFSELYEACWYCEFGNHTRGPCKKCESCTTHQMAELYIESLESSNDSGVIKFDKSS